MSASSPLQETALFLHENSWNLKAIIFFNKPIEIQREMPPEICKKHNIFTCKNKTKQKNKKPQQSVRASQACSLEPRSLLALGSQARNTPYTHHLAFLSAKHRLAILGCLPP